MAKDGEIVKNILTKVQRAFCYQTFKDGCNFIPLQALKLEESLTQLY